MSWAVSFQVISGAFGSRPSDDRNQIWVGETVRFTLSLEGDPDPAQTRNAQDPRNWLQAPQLVVTGSDSRERLISIPVRHDPTNPLLFNYLFRFEGRKQLRFTGMPREVALPTREAIPPTMRRPVAPTSVLFPPVQYEMQLQVVSPPRTGRDVASMQGVSSQTARQGRREYEDLSSRHRASEAEIGRAIADDRRARREIAERRRLERGVRDGILDFTIQTEAELRRIDRTSELEEYLLNLQSAIAATPPLNLRRMPDRRHPQDPGVVISHYWDAVRLENGDIAFFQIPTARSTRPPGSRGREIVYISDSERERVRRETQVVFPENTWIVAIRPGERRKLLFLASELGRDLSWENLWGRFNAVSFVLGLAVAPGSTISAYLGDLLLDTLLPPRAISAVSTAQLLADLVNGLRFALSLAFRRPTGRLAGGSLRQLGSASETVDSGRRASTPPRSTSATSSRSPVERGTLDRGGSGRRLPPDTSSGGGRLPPPPESSGELRGRRRSRYRGPEQPVTGRIDSVIRSEGLVQDASPGELMAAEALGRTGREVILLPETEAGWTQLAFQTGWSRDRRDSLRRQLAEAIRRDRLSSSRDPDLLINGRVWDVLAPSTLRGGNTLDERALTSIVQGIWSKGQSRQTRRVAYVVDGYSEGLPEIRSALSRHLGSTPSPFGANIDEVVLIQQGRLIEIYSRGRGISP